MVDLSAGTPQQLHPELAAEHFTVSSIASYQPVGEATRRFDYIFTSNTKIAREENRATLSILIGYFGMGKTLLTRRELIYASRNYEDVIPIYIPLRRLAEESYSTFNNLVKKYQIPAKDVGEVPPLTLALAWWLENGAVFVGKDVMEMGRSKKGYEKKRTDVLGEVLRHKPEKLNNLVNIIVDQGFVPLIAIDETEAMVLRRTRNASILIERYGLGRLVFEEVLRNVYSLVRSTPGTGGFHVVLATALDPRGGEWLEYPLEELARTPYDDALARFLMDVVGVESRIVNYVKGPPNLEERLKAAHMAAEQLRDSILPFRNPAVAQVLNSITVELKYTASEYKEFIEKYLGFRVLIPALAKMLEHMQLSFRTLIGIAKNIRASHGNVEIFDYNTIGLAFANTVNMCYSIEEKLVREKVVPRHTKWFGRVCKLIEKGLVILHEDRLVPDIEMQYSKEYAEVVKDIIRKLCEVLDVKFDEHTYFYASTFEKLKNRLKNIEEWGVLKLMSVRGGERYFVIDETILRCLLGDPYDIVGNTVNLYEYIKEKVRERVETRRSRSAGVRR